MAYVEWSWNRKLSWQIVKEGTKSLREANMLNLTYYEGPRDPPPAPPEDYVPLEGTEDTPTIR